MANSVDPVETAHNEPSQQSTPFAQVPGLVYMDEMVNTKNILMAIM